MVNEGQSICGRIFGILLRVGHSLNSHRTDVVAPKAVDDVHHEGLLGSAVKSFEY